MDLTAQGRVALVCLNPNRNRVNARRPMMAKNTVHVCALEAVWPLQNSKSILYLLRAGSREGDITGSGLIRQGITKYHICAF